MIQKKKEYPSVQLGSSLMLVILVVLCLTVFATLSLVSALKDSKYSAKSAEKTYHYYQADAKANRILEEISTRLQQGDSLDNLNLTVSEDTNGTMVQYQVPVSEQQLLSVTLLLNDEIAPDSGYYHIVEWKEIAASEWKPNTTLPVFGSDK